MFMSQEMPQGWSRDSRGEVQKKSWQELISDLIEKWHYNKADVERLKVQAHLRLADLQNTFPNGSPALRLEDVSFDVDIFKKQVLRAVLNETPVKE